MALRNYEAYEVASAAREEAEKWVHLNGKDGYNNRLKLSPAHCKVELTIAGQLNYNADSYHHAPKKLCSTIIDIINEEFEVIMNKALKKLKDKELELLIASRKEIQEIESKIKMALNEEY